MSASTPVETVEIRGIKLRRDPAREPCFAVVHSLHEMRSASIDTPVARREFMHRDVNNEIQSLEIAAQTLGQGIGDTDRDSETEHGGDGEAAGHCK